MSILRGSRIKITLPILLLTCCLSIDKANAHNIDIPVDHFSKSQEFIKSNDLDMAYYHAREALKLALQEGEQKAIGKAYWIAGYIHYIKGNLSRAFEEYLSAKKVYESIQDYQSLNKIEENLGTIALDEQNYEVAIEMFSIRKKTADMMGGLHSARAYFDLGIAYFNDSQISKSYEMLIKAAGIYETMDEIKVNELARTYIQIGICYFHLARDLPDKHCYDSALAYYQKAESLDESKIIQAMCTNNIGNVHLHRNEHIKALNMFRRTLEIKEIIASDRLMTSTLKNMGILYFKENQYDSSACYFQASINKNNGFMNHAQNLSDQELFIEMNKSEDLMESYIYLDSIAAISPGTVKTESFHAINRYRDLLKENRVKAFYIDQQLITISYLRYIRNKKWNNLREFITSDRFYLIITVCLLIFCIAVLWYRIWKHRKLKVLAKGQKDLINDMLKYIDHKQRSKIWF
ncbi:MAG: tetratricopeptide repeat protein [Bacteroidota bacterium]